MIEAVKTPIKYFLYARKSSESEDKQVASIPSQVEELKRIAKQQNINILEILTEEKSAKSPGRPVFSNMIERIHKGEAQGIICWKLDRLARNPIDGGTISWLLQQSIIQHIQTFQRPYYPTDNVLMMNLEFGMANQYILDLSENVKRGLGKKVKEKWFPHKTPLGYLNNKYKQPELPPIYEDPERFHLLRQLWDTLLEKKCSLNTLYHKAKDIGLTTKKGKPIAKSIIHLIFRNPFYYGYFYWKGELYPGKHEPMITKEEYDRAQIIIIGKRPTYKKDQAFAFTGLIRCGECGASITAEDKTKYQKNGNIHHYTYYRCTKRINPKCSQKTIRDTNLENQILEVLENIRIPEEFHKWAIKYLKEEQSKETNDSKEILESQLRRLDNSKKKLNSLFEMRMNEELSAEEYKQRKEKLLEEKLKYEQLISDTNYRFETWLDNAEKLFTFAETAKERFETGSLIVKREILACLGSNLILQDRRLNIQLLQPLNVFVKLAPEVRALHNRLEPLQVQPEQEFMEALYAKNEKWLGYQDSNLG